MATFHTGKEANSKRADYALAKEIQIIFKQMIESCMKGQLKDFETQIDAFLSSNPDTDAEDVFSEFQSEGKTLTHIACSCGHLSIFEVICKKSPSGGKALVNLQDNAGFTPFIYATISENIDIMKKLVALGADVNMRNEDGAAAIHFAAGDGCLERVRWLVEQGANVDYPSGGGTPLHWAAAKAGGGSDAQEACAFLASHCKDVDAPNSEGVSALLTSAAASADGPCAALVMHGADCGLIYSGNLTVLHICAENGLEKACDAIVTTDSGRACLAEETVDGNLPVHLAAMGGHRMLVSKLLHHSQTLEEVPSQLRTKTVDAIMEDAPARLRAWEAKHGPSSGAKDSMSGLGDHEIAASSTVSAEARERSEALKDEGNALFKKKQFLQAAEAYTQAIKLCGDNKAVWSNRSATFLELGRIEDAIRDAEICRRLEPTWPKGCYRLAVARLAAGLYEDAAIAAFEGCKIDGNNKELQKVMRDAVAKGKMEHQQKQQQSQQQLRQANARII